MIERATLAAIGIGLLATAAFAQTPEPADPAIVALSADLQASNTANGHMVQSLQALVTAYQGEKAKVVAAQKRAADLEAYWQAYIAGPMEPKP